MPSNNPKIQEAIQKADVLVDALEYIRRFRDRHIVIKLGGSALEEPEAVREFLTDVIFLESVGMKPIIVHGGGKSISRAMKDAGIEPRFVQGRRFTDESTMSIVGDVLAGEICEAVVQEIQAQGGRAVGLNFKSQNILIAEKLMLDDEASGEKIDLGQVGHVVDIQRDILLAMCRADTIPVLPSVAKDRDGKLMNVNADTAAAAVARLIHAEKLVFVSDVPGICMDRHDPTTLISHLDAAKCRELMKTGVIDAGMIPKVEAAIDALKAGVKKIHLIDARIPHALLLEIYSSEGIGTEIVL
jgi:acetylglutamate kinase